MLTKEKCLQALLELSVYAEYNTNEVERKELAKESNLLRQLINEHFELVKENEELKNQLVEIESSLSRVSTQENSNQPLKFEDLKGIYRII